MPVFEPFNKKEVGGGTDFGFVFLMERSTNVPTYNSHTWDSLTLISLPPPLYGNENPDLKIFLEFLKELETQMTHHCIIWTKTDVVQM